VAPNDFNNGTLIANPRTVSIMETEIIRVRAFPNIFSACALSFLPSAIDVIIPEPIPKSIPNPIMIIIIGNTTVRPESAACPTPCPIKIRPIIL